MSTSSEDEGDVRGINVDSAPEDDSDDVIERGRESEGESESEERDPATDTEFVDATTVTRLSDGRLSVEFKLSTPLKHIHFAFD
ncbi:hypothetical protein KIPB_006871, partial [Kipferlia bialata]|eukprot:g6871.t1